MDSEVDSLVEVQGFVTDKTTINGTYYINLPSTITHDFGTYFFSFMYFIKKLIL